MKRLTPSYSTFESMEVNTHTIPALQQIGRRTRHHFRRNGRARRKARKKSTPLPFILAPFHRRGGSDELHRESYLVSLGRFVQNRWEKA